MTDRPAGWTLVEWDSAFFGVPVARAEHLITSKEEAAVFCLALQEGGIALCYVTGSEPEVFEQTGGVQSVYTDERRTYSKPVDAAGVKDNGGQRLEQLSASHVGSEAVRQLALASGAHSRFRLDPHFPSETFEALYAQWIMGSLQGDGPDAVVYGVQDDGRVVGLISARADEACAVIGLVAVEERARGRGLGGHLLHAIERWALDQELLHVRVTTQAANTAARRLYERHGYALASTDTLLHVWLA